MSVSTPTLPKANRLPWQRLALAGVLLLAVFLHFFRLEQEGTANPYYAAAVKSMLLSWRNFFFVSFDPAGFVSVDKPPLGLWVQAASAALFGFRGWSLILPQALAAVLSVALLYHLVRRIFGPVAGVMAALVLTLTPISIAANRNNTMDSQLVFTSLLAAWAFSLAAERGRLRWLLVGAALVGVGFNIKMLQAFLVLPAFYLLYLVTAPAGVWKRLWHLALASAVLAVISLSWAVAVDLTPQDSRPYVGSSKDNTVMELIVGHNAAARLGGLNRLFGRGPGNPPPNRPPVPPPNPPGPGRPQPGGPQPAPNPLPPSGAPGGAAPGPGPRGMQDETGLPGPLRLFNRSLGGQASWLLPLALFGLAAAAWGTRLRWPLAPQVVFFSFAGLFHRYYLEMLAPAIAALAGAGLVALWEGTVAGGHEEGGHKARPYGLPLALAVGAGTETVLLAAWPQWSPRLTPLVVGLVGLAAGGLVGLRVVRDAPASLRRLQAACAVVGVLALLIAPGVWSAFPVWTGGDVRLPYASPELLERPGGAQTPDVSCLVGYLAANRGGAKFLAAMLNANTAAPLILATGQPVMAMGGFSGGDAILTADDLAARVAGGEVRFFLVPLSQPQPSGGQNNPSPLPTGDPNRALAEWVNEHCAVVPAELWQSAPRVGGPPVNAGPGEPVQLFDCGITRRGKASQELATSTLLCLATTAAALADRACASTGGRRWR